MRVLVYSHRLMVGGSERVAIELAAAIQDRGHDVVVVGPPGPMAAIARDAGLRVVIVGTGGARSRPLVGAGRQLRRLVRGEEIDLVHAYELTATLEVFYGAHLLDGTPMVSSVLRQRPPLGALPASIPLVVGRRAVRQRVEHRRPGPVAVVEPPIPTVDRDVDTSAFFAAHALDPAVPLLVLVSRLTSDKLEPVTAAIQAVDTLARERPVGLVIVGDGGGRPAVEAAARRVNDVTGRRAIVFTGELVDPRPAFAAADLVVGNATAVEWGMAHGKPAIVVDEKGAWLTVEPAAEEYLREHGPFVSDDGAPSDRLGPAIAKLLDDPVATRQSAEFGRELTRDRTAERTAAGLERVYEQAVEQGSSNARRWRQAIRAGVGLAAVYGRRQAVRLRRWRRSV